MRGGRGAGAYAGGVLRRVRGAGVLASEVRTRKELWPALPLATPPAHAARGPLPRLHGIGLWPAHRHHHAPRGVAGRDARRRVPRARASRLARCRVVVRMALGVRLVVWQSRESAARGPRGRVRGAAARGPRGSAVRRWHRMPRCEVSESCSTLAASAGEARRSRRGNAGGQRRPRAPPPPHFSPRRSRAARPTGTYTNVACARRPRTRHGGPLAPRRATPAGPHPASLSPPPSGRPATAPPPSPKAVAGTRWTGKSRVPAPPLPRAAAPTSRPAGGGARRRPAPTPPRLTRAPRCALAPTPCCRPKAADRRPRPRAAAASGRSPPRPSPPSSSSAASPPTAAPPPPAPAAPPPTACALGASRARPTTGGT